MAQLSPHAWHNNAGSAPAIGCGKGNEHGRPGKSTVGLEQALERVHLVLLALDLQRDGAQRHVADGAMENVRQVAQLPPQRRRASHLRACMHAWTSSMVVGRSIEE